MKLEGSPGAWAGKIGATPQNGLKQGGMSTSAGSPGTPGTPGTNGTNGTPGGTSKLNFFGTSPSLAPSPVCHKANPGGLSNAAGSKTQELSRDLRQTPDCCGTDMRRLLQ